jgi:hypothetical protein
MKIKRERALLLIKIAVLGICYYIFVVLTGSALPCPVNLLTGGCIKCPGCGISSMCINLFKLEIREAFRCNPVIFSSIPVWTLCVGMWLFGKGERFNRAIIIVSIIILLVFGIVRNII